MQIPKIDIDNTIAFIVNDFRRKSLEGNDIFLIDLFFDRSKANLRGIAMLIPSIGHQIRSSLEDLQSFYSDASLRLQVPIISDQSSDLGRSPVSSPVDVGQGGN